MAFGFLGRIAQDIGHDVSVVARGNNNPGGGVFGFLQGTKNVAQNIIRTDITNPTRQLAAQITHNPVAEQNAIQAQNKSVTAVAPVIQGITRTAPEAIQTVIHPFSQHTYTPGSSLEQAVFGSTPVQNIQEKVAKNYDAHPGLNPVARVGLAAGEGALSVAQDTPFGFLGKITGKTALNAGKTVNDAKNAALEAQVPRATIKDQQVLNDYNAYLVGTYKPGAELNQLVRDAKAVGEKHGIDLTANATKESRINATADLLDQIGKQRRAAGQQGFIGGFTDHTIETPSGTVKLTQDELDQLSKAKTPTDVKAVLGDELPAGNLNRIANAVANTKDPNIIKNIIGREFRPSEPVKVGADIAPAQLSEPVTQEGTGSLGQSDAAKQVTDTLAQAQKTRNLQEQGYTAERSARIGASQAAGADLPGLAGHQAELSALKGELGKQDYQGLAGHLSPTEQDNLFTQLRQEVNQNPDIQGYAKLNTNEAIRKVIYGDKGVPTNSELNLLRNALGDKFVEPLKEDIQAHNERLGALQTFGQKTAQIAGLPRELMATADFSGGLRQGLAAATRHPIVFAKAFAKQFKFFGSEDAYHKAEQAIYDHPDYNLLHQSGTSILELDKKLGPTEEKFISNLGEKIPIVGKLIRASNRAYTGLLNNMRANIFYDKVATLRNAGYDLNSPENAKLIKDLGTVINTSTGRGNLGRFETAGQALSTALFAPRLIASRLSMLDPRYYINLEGPARKEALQTLLSLGAFGTGILYLAELAGAKVTKDPTNADFGKVRIGDTRLDPLGGFAQYIRLGAQLAEGKKTNSTTGATTELGKGIAGSRWDVFTNFLANKEAPVPSFVTTALKGKDAAGNPIDYKKEVLSRFTPLLAQDLKDLYSHPQGAGGSNAGRIGSAVAGTFGVGLQTYSSQDNPLSAKQKTYIQSLKDQGADQPTVKASTSFFQNLKEAAGTRMNVNTAVDKAIAANDLPKAQQLADQYNKELAAGMTKWSQQYGEQYGNQDLQTAYDRQKINLTPSSLQSRIKSLQSNKPY